MVVLVFVINLKLAINYVYVFIKFEKFYKSSSMVYRRLIKGNMFNIFTRATVI